VLSGKHMMMGPACFSDRAVHVATHGFLLLIYTLGSSIMAFVLFDHVAAGLR
jgi:hypothetical protein